MVAAVVGTVTLLLGAGGVFGALKDALNTIWGVAPKPDAGFMKMVRDRFLSFSMVLGVGFLLMVSLTLSAGISALSKYLGDRIPGVPFVWESLNTVVSVGVFALLFAMIYKALPDAKVQWRDVWIGALLTAIVFTLGKVAIGLYLGRGAVGSAYGAAGSLVVLLLWIYYSAQILFFGAEFTKVFATRRGSKIVPNEDAEPLSPEARADQGLAPAHARAAGTVSSQQAQQAEKVPQMALIGPERPRNSKLCTDNPGNAVRIATLVGAVIGLLVGLIQRPQGTGRA